MQMWKLPNVLLIHLKRFHYTRFFRDKVCELVHFPTRGLDLSPYVLGPGAGKARYNLLGVSNHMGRLGGGHYTANILHTPSGRWLNFNDSWVNTPNNIKSKSHPTIPEFLRKINSMLSNRRYLFIIFKV